MVAIERVSIDFQAQLACGLTSTMAQAFLERTPRVDALMPPLKVPVVEQLLDANYGGYDYQRLEMAEKQAEILHLVSRHPWPRYSSDPES